MNDIAVTTAAPPTCDARQGFRANEDGYPAPLWCSVSIGLRSYQDTAGFTRRYCAQHEQEVRGRWPELAPLACYFCKRTRPIALGIFTRINFGGSIQLVCDDCYEKGNEERDEIVVEDHGAYVVTVDDDESFR